jgi:hypothetical protein
MEKSMLTTSANDSPSVAGALAGYVGEHEPLVVVRNKVWQEVADEKAGNENTCEQAAIAERWQDYFSEKSFSDSAEMVHEDRKR